MPNIAIRQTGVSGDGSPLYATTKVFLREDHIWPPLKAGDIVEVSEGEAKSLLGSPLRLALEVTYEDSNRVPPPGLDDIDEHHISPEHRPALIRSALRRIDQEDRDLWTDAGKPLVAAVEALLGFDISAAERDLEWDNLDLEVK